MVNWFVQTVRIFAGFSIPTIQTLKFHIRFSRIHRCASMYVCSYVYVCMFMCAYVSTTTHTHTHTHAHVHTYTHTNMQTHTCTKTLTSSNTALNRPLQWLTSRIMKNRYCLCLINTRWHCWTIKVKFTCRQRKCLSI